MSKSILVITHSSQIEDLPWVGNFGADSILFDEVDKYIFLPTTSVNERIEALKAMSWYGMGVDEPVLLKDLAEYLNLAYDASRLPYYIYKAYLDQIEKYEPLTYPVPNGQIVKLDTGEMGVVVRECPSKDEPLIVHMGDNATRLPKIKIADHSIVEMQVYINPDEK